MRPEQSTILPQGWEHIGCACGSDRVRVLCRRSVVFERGVSAKAIFCLLLLKDTRSNLNCACFAIFVSGEHDSGVQDYYLPMQNSLNKASNTLSLCTSPAISPSRPVAMRSSSTLQQ